MKTPHKGIFNFHNHTVLLRFGRGIFVTYGLLTGAAFAAGTIAALLYHAAKRGDELWPMIQFYGTILFPSVILRLPLVQRLSWRVRTFCTHRSIRCSVSCSTAACSAGLSPWRDTRSTRGSSMLGMMDAWAFAMPLGEAIYAWAATSTGCCWGIRPIRRHCRACRRGA